MNEGEKADLLRLLDEERQTVVFPGVTRRSESGVICEVAADGGSCEVVYSSCSEAEVDAVIGRQVEAARREGWDLEWKVYGHDRPACLGERLVAAGFEADARESFMVFRASEASLSRFGGGNGEVRRVTWRDGLEDYQSIVEEARGRSCAREVAQYARMLEQHPENMSVYVAYVGGEPAACGRVYFHQESRFAGLYGGNTRERFRRRGLFTQVVAARIREALSRGIVNVCVDALPTSEPILGKRGFESLTYTQPFHLLNNAQ